MEDKKAIVANRIFKVLKKEYGDDYETMMEIAKAVEFIAKQSLDNWLAASWDELLNSLEGW